jgi:hypothetical protein
VLTAYFALGECPEYPTNRRRVRLHRLLCLSFPPVTWYVSRPVSPFDPVALLPHIPHFLSRQSTIPEYIRRPTRHSGILSGWTGPHRQVEWRRGGASRKRHWNVQVGAAQRSVIPSQGQTREVMWPSSTCHHTLTRLEAFCAPTSDTTRRELLISTPLRNRRGKPRFSPSPTPPFPQTVPPCSR